MQLFDNVNMENNISPNEVKDKLYKLYARNLIDEQTFQEIHAKLDEESKYEKQFFQELLKRFNERLDFKLEQGMLNYLKKNLK